MPTTVQQQLDDISERLAALERRPVDRPAVDQQQWEQFVLQVITRWWSIFKAVDGNNVFVDRTVAARDRGADKRWTYTSSDEAEPHTDLLGEHRAHAFRGPLFHGKDEIGDGMDVVVKGGDGGTTGGSLEVRAGDSDTAPGLQFLRGGVDPDDDPTYPTSGHIYLHPSISDVLGAISWLHLAAGVSAETWPRAVEGSGIYVNAPITLQDYTLDQLPTPSYSGQIAFITDSDTDVPGELVTGGGDVFAIVWCLDGKDWYVLGAPALDGGGSGSLGFSLDGLGE